MSAGPGGAALRVEILSAERARAVRDELAFVLADCVAGGASISFMSPFTLSDAALWWDRVIRSVDDGQTVLFAAFRDGAVVGSVQLGLDTPPNQPHRADVKKLIVHRAARGCGAGLALMTALETEARRRGLTLLTLDTASAAADRIYRGLGWTEAGVIPNYALFPGGGFCDTTLFWKAL